jgi:hypothetical protein
VYDVLRLLGQINLVIFWSFKLEVSDFPVLFKVLLHFLIRGSLVDPAEENPELSNIPSTRLFFLFFGLGFLSILVFLLLLFFFLSLPLFVLDPCCSLQSLQIASFLFLDGLGHLVELGDSLFNGERVEELERVALVR